MKHRDRQAQEQSNPDGNERLTAAVGALLLAPIIAELVSVFLGVHTFMSLHVFVGLLLIPPVLLKLASTGWRFARYYLRSDAYVVHGPPKLAMRMLAPLLVAATVVLLGSGVAMGVVHGHALVVARRLHGPASVVWTVLLGVHVLVYLKRSLIKGTEDIIPGTRSAVHGARSRAFAVVLAVATGVAVALATVPAQHRWVNLRHDHRLRGAMRRVSPGADGTPRRARHADAPPRLRPTTRVFALFSVSVRAPASTRTVLLGRSWQGRPIDAVEVGNPSGTRVLVVGCIHGDETAGIRIAERLEHLAPADLDLWIVPDLNPDGVAADIRHNARGVDLNRNFPWRWRPLRGVYDSGPHPLSEREARIAHALILRLHPRVTIWFHQHLDMVWASGGDRRIEKRFARVSGLPYHPMPQLAGSAISWQNNALHGTTAFAAELPAGQPTRTAVARDARAVLWAARTP